MVRHMRRISALVALSVASEGAAELVRGPWSDIRLPAAIRARLLVHEMTLDEKLAMLHGPVTGDSCACNYSATCAYMGNVAGNTRLGIPPITMNDGPQGFRSSYDGTTTAFPAGQTMAATWDPKLVFEWGRAMGREFFLKGANTQLGPGVNVARTPLNGRNFEYLSGEDPYLGSQLAGPAVRGIQSQKVVATVKHWVNNNQEYFRENISAEVDERTRFEIYYPPFEAAAKALAGSFMCGYNKINDRWSCENPETLQRDLKEIIGFKGYVMSDWSATHSPSINAGLDMEMPNGTYLNPTLLKLALQAGTVKEWKINDSVERILTPMFRLGIMDEPLSTWDWKNQKNNVTNEAAMHLTRHLSAQSTVLLKNEGGILPLKTSTSVALIGFADKGAVVHGLGSGQVFPSKLVTPLVGVRAALDAEAKLLFEDGTDMDAAVAAAKEAEVAIVFVGTTASEACDRKSLSLDDGCVYASCLPGFPVYDTNQCTGNARNQNAMVEAIAAANKRTIVVASVPGPVLMPWAGKVQAILTNFMPGQEAGNAIADILFGKVNPVARLPVTFPNKENEINFSPAQYPGVGLAASEDPYQATYAYYTEQLFVGYRYYDAHDIQFTTGFPFGHGLSYTSFTYSHLSVCQLTWRVSFVVKNTGSVAGAEVAQLYVQFPVHAQEPLWQLKGFKKTKVLAPGEEERVVLRLTRRDLSVWCPVRHRWSLVHGAFALKVGASSRDTRLSGKLAVVLGKSEPAEPQEPQDDVVV